VIFRGLDVWSDVECAGGVRLAWLPLGSLAAAAVQYSLDALDTLTAAVWTGDPAVAQLVRGRVVRVVYDDPAAFEEWRIRETQVDGDASLLTVLCDSIGLDLARAAYAATDGNGATVTAFDAIGIDAEGIIDGPVRDALDEAGLTWIVKGTVTPTGTFDLTVDWPSARTLVLEAATRSGGELQVRRNGTTDYRIDIVDRIGATADLVRVRTARNLLASQRTFDGARAGSRVIVRGKDDSTSRTIGYAFWEVTATGTSGGNDTITIRDPRGTGFPAPGGSVANRLGGNTDPALPDWYVCKLQPTFAASQVLGSLASTGDTTTISVTSGQVAAQGITAGDYVEFRLGNTVDAPRPWYLSSDADLAAGGGLFDRIFDRTTLSGAVNYAPNALVTDFTGTLTYTQSDSGGITCNTGSATATMGVATPQQSFVAGDVLLRASDDAVIGTILTVNPGDVTLTANAALTLTNAAYKVRRAAPAGTRVSAANNVRWQPTAVAANVPNIASSAWSIVQGATASGTPFVELPVSRPFTGLSTAWQFGVWCECVTIDTGGSVVLSLRRADTGAAIGTTVTLTDAQDGTLARVVFSGLDISAAAAGVVIRVETFWGGSGAAPTEITLGPWWCQPASWDGAPQVLYGGCDLWHEANIFLDTQGQPVSYAVSFADLASVSGASVADVPLTLGGDVLIDDRELGILAQQRLVAYSRDLLAPGNAALTLGRRDRTLAEYLATQSGLSVADVALALANGLTRDARALTTTPIIEATPGTILTADPAIPETIAFGLRSRFQSF
jgi:hypothetical protein